MKKEALAIAAALIMTFVTGCASSSEKKENDNRSVTQNNTQVNTQQSQAVQNDSQNGAAQNNSIKEESKYNPPEQDNTDDDYDYDWVDENMTYGDFVMLYRDEIVDGARSVTYQQLARSADGMEGEYVKLKGQITQIYDTSDGTYDYYEGMMSITYVPDEYFPYYTDSVLIAIPVSFVSQRPLVDDIITIWGVSSGLTSYETVLGDTRTEPTIIAAKVQFINNGY